MAGTTPTDRKLRTGTGIGTTIEKCRVCLKKGAIPIFGDSSSEDISYNVIACTGILMMRDDHLPKYLCKYCFKQLQAAILFRKTAKRSDLLLRKKNSEINCKRIQLKSGCSSSTETGLKHVGKNVETKRPKAPVKHENSVKKVKENNIFDAGDYLENNSEITCKRTKLKRGCSFNTKTGLKNAEKRVKKVKENSIFDAEDDLKKNREIKRQQLKNGCSSNTETGLKHAEKNFEPNGKAPVKHENIVNKVNQENDIFDADDDFQIPIVDEEQEERAVKISVKSKVNEHSHIEMKILNKDTTNSEKITKKTFECKSCQKKFSQSYYYAHMKSEHKTKVECPICKKFYSPLYIKTHEHMHALKEKGEPSYVCDVCGKECHVKQVFLTHLLIHTNEFRYHCDFCPYRGRTRDLLLTHLRTHTGDYPHKCPQCSARYIKKSNLNTHIAKHHGTFKFICDICKKSFYTKLILERHVQVDHLGSKDHKCDICGMAFGYRRYMMKHQLKVHKRAKLRSGKQPTYLEFDNV